MAIGIVTATDLSITTTLGQDFEATEGTLTITLMRIARDGWNRQIDFGQDIKLQPGMTFTKTFRNIERDGIISGLKKIPAAEFSWRTKKGIRKGQIRLHNITFDLDGNSEPFCYYPPFANNKIKGEAYRKVRLSPCIKK